MTRARGSIAVSPAHSGFGLVAVGKTMPVQSSSHAFRGTGLSPERTSHLSHAWPVNDASV
jgi:hypothetical protein